MLRFVTLLSLLASVLGAALFDGLVPEELDGRIVGGHRAFIINFPWQISLQERGSQTCGGTIYSELIILTAAHCLTGTKVSELSIRAGTNQPNDGGVVRNVAAYKIHPNYQPATSANDVAVILLKSPLILGPKIRKIPLAANNPDNNAPARISGWGSLQSGGSYPLYLRAATVRIITSVNCASDQYNYGNQIKAGMICAAAPGKDSCQGDSGGPMVSNGVLVGVVSWGNGCADLGYPGVYASVAFYRSWFVNTASNLVQNG